MHNVRRIITFATAGACALAVASSAQAATVTAVPSTMGAVVTGQHPEVTVTFHADPGMAFAHDDGAFPLTQTYETAWDEVSDTCNGPLSVPGTPVTSCSALMRVHTEEPGINLGVPLLHLDVLEFDPDGVKPSSVVQLDATVPGGITYPPARATRAASVTPSFVHQSGTAVFRVAYNLGMTGSVKVVSVRTGKVVRTFAVNVQSSWQVRWHGRDDHGHKVAPGRYRMRAVAHVKRPFIATPDVLRSHWVTTLMH
jgi:FlgD Ig-like domain